MNLRKMHYLPDVNHLDPNATTALINQLGGVAGQIIDLKKSGQQVSGASNQLANLSQQTLAALGLAQQQQTAAPPPVQAPNYTPIYIAIAAGLAGIGLLIYMFKAR